MVQKLEQITQEEFELNLTESIMGARKSLNDILEIYNIYYLIDKGNYALTYFKKGREYRYTKSKKERLGFK